MFHVEQHNKEGSIANPTDHLVSGKSFYIRWLTPGSLAITQPFPEDNELASYYADEKYIPHGNQKKTIVDHLYGIVQKIMYRQKLRWMTPFFDAAPSYLDFGAGTGEWVQYLLSKNIHAEGVEPSDRARAYLGKSFLAASLTQLKTSSFQAIGLWHVLEHLPRPAETLQTLSSRLSNKGTLIIALPNLASYDAHYYGDYWAGYDVPRHLWHFTKKGVLSLAAENGFALSKTKSLFFDAFYVCYLSEKYRKKRFPLIRGILVGAYSNILSLWTKEPSSVVYFFSKT